LEIGIDLAQGASGAEFAQGVERAGRAGRQVGLEAIGLRQRQRGIADVAPLAEDSTDARGVVLMDGGGGEERGALRLGARGGHGEGERAGVDIVVLDAHD
jgi:hypothetical protein